jgi:MFS-type transporter involved in bile tolerance (Atg22 family)
MKVILLRNFLFSLVISIVPALLPVLALKEMHLSASQLGLLFTCVGVGSLAGAVFALPYLRERTSSNAITSISVAIMAVVLLVMSFTPQRESAGKARRTARLDGMRGIGGRGLGAGGIRALGRWTTGDAGMGCVDE